MELEELDDELLLELEELDELEELEELDELEELLELEEEFPEAVSLTLSKNISLPKLPE